MDITELSAGDDRAAIARLCDKELVLDRDAGLLPGVLMRRPHIALVAMHESRTLGACFGSVEETGDGVPQGFIDLLVVDSAEQRRGIGRRLADAMENVLASRGCEKIRIEGHGSHYAWPGIDIHYTAAICLVEDLGYRRGSCEVNMDVDLLHAPLETQADEDRLRSEGIEIRRADSDDDGPLQESLASTWQPVWIAEAMAALRGADAGLHIALRDQRCVGFCAYGVKREHEVGPLGTAPGSRRLGIGTVLLKRCLAEQRSRGLTTAELVWAGPLSYFSRAVHATIGRAFWRYEKDLAAPYRPAWLADVGLARTRQAVSGSPAADAEPLRQVAQ